MIRNHGFRHHRLHHHHHASHAQQTQQTQQTQGPRPAGQPGVGDLLQGLELLGKLLHASEGHHCWDRLPAPGPDQTSPPAGKGLEKASDFGPNAIRTAGGYVIVPEGNQQAWSIYAPGQKPGDKPNTRVWGDPHVQEADGTRWDFTKNSNFRLPDGTNISVTTTKQDGYSLSSKLDITNGLDRVQVSGIENNQPKVGEITHDGYAARANLNSNDTFVLGGDGQGKVQWFREKEGKIEGEVVGARMGNVGGVQQYEQILNKDTQYVVDPSLQPKVGTEAWGNKLRDEAVDAVRNLFGSGSFSATTAASGAETDHLKAEAAAQKPPANPLEQFLSDLRTVMALFKLFNAVSSVKARVPVSV